MFSDKIQCSSMSSEFIRATLLDSNAYHLYGFAFYTYEMCIENRNEIVLSYYIKVNRAASGR